MAYNDRQLLAFTQIAYMDLGDRFEFYSTGGTKPVPLLYLLEDSERKKLLSIGITDDDLKQWSLADAHDTNTKNGFYGCIIDTGGGNAVMAFRGSESMNADNWLPDWIEGDAMLLTGDMTKQQKEVHNFLKKVSEDETLNQYHYTTVGHSLGGNLSEYAAIVSDQYHLDDQIDRCVSLDGPGFSQKFIDDHKEQIHKMGNKITHYRWSLVGSLLHDLPIDKARYQYVEVSYDVKKSNKINDLFNCFLRHDVKYTELNSDGYFYITDSPDEAAVGAGFLSKMLDTSKFFSSRFLPSNMRFYMRYINILRIVFIGLLGQSFYTSELGKKIAPTGEEEAYSSFYIDTEHFEHLASQSTTVADSLSEIARTLRKLDSMPQISTPRISSPAIQQILEWINDLFRKLNHLQDAAFYSSRIVEESAETMQGVTVYLRDTAFYMNRVEDEAVRIIHKWEAGT